MFERDGWEGLPGEYTQQSIQARGAGDQKLLYFKCDEKTWGSMRTTAPHCCLHNSRGIRVIISTFQLRNLEPNNVW